jgi:hypothetical protein
VIGRRRNRSYQLIAIAVIAALSTSVIAGTVGIAQALLISEEEHWKYSVDKWAWDGDRRRTYGLVTPQVIIQNETADRLEGFVVDANGTRLDFYDGDQVVHVRYLSNSSGGSAWMMAGMVHDGYFAIEIPQNYRESEIVKIFIGNHQYTVNNGTPTTPQTEVYFNAAMLTYRTNSTLDQMAETEVAEVQEPEPVSSIISRGSLIDYILSKYGLLPIRSSDSGE